MNAAEANQAAVGDRPAKKNGFSIVRIVLLLVLLVMLVLLAIDWRARGAYQTAFEKLEAADAESNTKNGRGLTPTEVVEIVGHEGVKEDHDHYILETYSWQGGLRKYHVYVAYNPGDPPTLHDVAAQTNDPNEFKLPLPAHDPKKDPPLPDTVDPPKEGEEKPAEPEAVEKKE